MTSAADNTPTRTAQIVNIALFSGALLLLAAGLGRARAEQGEGPELSEDEHRVLAPLPELDGESLVDGSFTTGVDAWVSDHFPGRPEFMAANFWLEAHRGRRGADEVAFYAVDIDIEAELEPLDGEVMAELALEPIDGELELDDPELDDPALDDPAAPHSIVKNAGVLVVDGQAMQLFAGSPKGSRRYARALNAYAKALPADVKLYSMIVPTAQTYYLPESYNNRVRHEPPNIAATYAMLDPEIIAVDVVDALRGHADEYIYFRTDHHWTGLGAYYAYVGFCRAAGLDPVPLDAMQTGVISPYRGSLYRYTRDLELRRKYDQVHYWIPPGEVEIVFGGGRSAKLVRTNSKGYGVFLGGDHPLMIAHSAAKTGRRALLIKNSYGNPFATYLAAHFETLVIVDYRKFDGSVLELVAEHGITDLIVLNGAITSNAKYHVARIDRLLDGGKRARRRGATEEAE